MLFRSGHDIADCYDLKQQIEALIREGKLQKFVSKERSERVGLVAEGCERLSSDRCELALTMKFLHKVEKMKERCWFL